MRYAEIDGGQEAEHHAILKKTGFWGKRAAGCIFLALDTGRLCIAHRSSEVEQPNTWGTWGGAIDSKENPKQAVQREVKEEAGFHGQLKLIPLFVFSHASGFKYFNFLALVQREFTPVMDWETQGYKWVEFGKWPKPLHNGLQLLLNDAASVNVIKKYIKNELGEARVVDPHAGNEIDISRDDPRFDMYHKAIDSYTHSGSAKIADTLHKLHRVGNFTNIKVGNAEDIQMLDDIMYNHPLKRAITVYHGLRESPARVWYTNGVPGNKPIRVHLPAFTSTSTLRIADGFTKHDSFSKVPIRDKRGDALTHHVLQIRVPAGIPGLSVREFSAFPDENEILLGRGIEIEIQPWTWEQQLKIPNHESLTESKIWRSRVVGYNPREYF